VPLTGLQRPCAAGLSFAVSNGNDVQLRAEIRFALYDLEEREREDESTRAETRLEGRGVRLGTAVAGSAHDATSGTVSGRKRRKTERLWHRHSFTATFPKLRVPEHANERVPVHCDGLPHGVSLHVRSSAGAAGTRLVTTGYQPFETPEGFDQRGMIRFWRVSDGAMRHEFSQGTSLGVTSPVAWNPGFTRFAFGTYDGHAVVATVPSP
jgi:hypothetical protein